MVKISSDTAVIYRDVDDWYGLYSDLHTYRAQR